MPKFNGDLGAFLSHEVKYPAKARKKSIQGRVIVEFVVDEEGNVIQATVVQKVDPMLDAEAKRAVLAMPRWQPGRQDGENVKVFYTLPITFELD